MNHSICNTIYNKVSSGTFFLLVCGGGIAAAQHRPVLYRKIVFLGGRSQCAVASGTVYVVLFCSGVFRARWYGGHFSLSFSQPSSWCCSISSVQE